MSLRPRQFAKSMIGDRGKGAIEEFWDHCLKCPEWASHPAFASGELCKDRLSPSLPGSSYNGLPMM